MKRLFRFIIIIISIVNINVSQAQYANILIGNEDTEPSIMINPKNPAQIVVATNKALIHSSSDSGKTWQSQFMPNANLFSGDPCVIVDHRNTFYFFSLNGKANTPGWLDQLICYKSIDGGITWTDSSHIGRNSPKDQDKEWAVFEPIHNNIYLTWTEFDQYGSKQPHDSSRILFSKSSDHALSWSVPIRLNAKSGDCADDDYTTEGAVPTVGPHGEIYVAWADMDGIKFDRSFDRGMSWLDNDIFVSTQPGGWNYNIPGIYRSNGLPVIDCDRSIGKYQGNLYINWSDQLNGLDDTDVWISVSSDSGSTWSPRKRVNDDPPGRHQFFSWMTVDQANGNIYVIFYDRRNRDSSMTDIFLAKSTDGGISFNNERINTHSFTPNVKVFIGDYINISAYQNMIRPVWTQLEGTSITLWTALIDYR